MSYYSLGCLENIKRNLKHLSGVIHRDMPDNNEALDLVNHINSLIDDSIVDQELRNDSIG